MHRYKICKQLENDKIEIVWKKGNQNLFWLIVKWYCHSIQKKSCWTKCIVNSHIIVCVCVNDDNLLLFFLPGAMKWIFSFCLLSFILFLTLDYIHNFFLSQSIRWMFTYKFNLPLFNSSYTIFFISIFLLLLILPNIFAIVSPTKMLLNLFFFDFFFLLLTRIYSCRVHTVFFVLFCSNIFFFLSKPHF